jgi:isocitrate lyase
MSTLAQETAEAAAWMASSRFDGIVRLHSARQVVEQRGTIAADHAVTRTAAEAFYARLGQLFEARQSITTFGPYSPGQAVAMKRLGIEGIYLGGWATSAKGSVTEDPGADLASYPLSQVPDEASAIVRALLTADRNQHFARARLTPAQLAETPEVDYRPFIIADADTGHGGDAHVRNLIRRFVEVGVPGFHIEDQKPGVKKCGHQGGKVLVAQHEQIQRLNAARLQLDIMRVPGIIVARTDAEGANLLDSAGDERDQPFILGATNTDVPSYRAVVLAIHRKFFELGVQEIRGHLMFAMDDSEYASANEWLTQAGLASLIGDKAAAFLRSGDTDVEAMLDAVTERFLERWQADSGLKTFGQAVAETIARWMSEGDEPLDMTVEEWRAFARTASLVAARDKAAALGIHVIWDCELPKTPEGYYQIDGGLPYAIAKSLSAAPFADLLWMETNTANIGEAAAYANAIHAAFPEKMLAYNLSPSFNWDTTGMTDDEMRRFPEELGKLGYVFNFITYGGHQIDGLAAEEFAISLTHDGMLALARLQRRLRLMNSPYRTPQTLAGGPRLDAALMAASGRTATTKAMGKGSTQHQHLVETEASPKLLEAWLETAARHGRLTGRFRAEMCPVISGSDLLELRVVGESNARRAHVVFMVVQDRTGGTVLWIREHHVFDTSLYGTRVMALVYLFLIHRYQATAVQYINPSEHESEHSRDMEDLGVFGEVERIARQMIFAQVSRARASELLIPQQLAIFIERHLFKPSPALRAERA